MALVVVGAREPRTFWTIVGTSAALTFLWAIYRVRVELDVNEVRVFNVRRTYRVRWATIARIDVVDWWLSPSVPAGGRPAVRLSTYDRARIVIDASANDVAPVLEALVRVAPEHVAITSE